MCVCFCLQVKSYIEIGRKDGRVLCGEGVDAPVQLPEGLQKVSVLG